MSPPPKTALLLGATGLVGNQLLPLLLASQRYDRVVVLLRRPLDMTHPKFEQQVVDFEQLPTDPTFYACDDLYFAFGTTIAKAGSQERFELVDLKWPSFIARQTRTAGCRQAMVVSSVGADASARIFYSRMKGLLEDNLRSLHFEGLHLFQPGVLMGDRQERRPGEAVAAFVSRMAEKLWPGLFGKYSGMPADVLAQAMLAAAASDKTGAHVHTWRSIVQLANQSAT